MSLAQDGAVSFDAFHHDVIGPDLDTGFVKLVHNADVVNERAKDVRWKRAIFEEKLVFYDFEWEEMEYNSFKAVLLCEGESDVAAKWKTTCFIFDIDPAAQKYVSVPADAIWTRFRLMLSPRYNSTGSMIRFEKSPLTDAVLLVGKRKMHVNKQFLAFQSYYFRSLFGGGKDGKPEIPEIRIDDVHFRDFARLLLAVYPNPLIPTEDTVCKVLELCERFGLRAARRVAEPVVIKATNMTAAKKLLLADRHELTEVLEATLRTFGHLDDLRRVGESVEYPMYSDRLKARLLDHFAKVPPVIPYAPVIWPVANQPGVVVLGAVKVAEDVKLEDVKIDKEDVGVKLQDLKLDDVKWEDFREDGDFKVRVMKPEDVKPEGVKVEEKEVKVNKKRKNKKR